MSTSTEGDRVGLEPSPNPNHAARAFVAHMRHELRTPINAILGYSEMLLEDMQAAGAQERCADLRRIHAAGAQLLSLVNDILDPIKVEAQAGLDVESFGTNVRHALRTPISALIGYCEMLTEDAEEEPEFLADIDKVRSAAEQLLSLSSDIVRLWQIQAHKAEVDVDADYASAVAWDAVMNIQARERERPAMDGSRGSVLVVEDDERSRDLAARLLSRGGYDVAVASDGRQAIEMVRAHSYDVMLLDIMMPGMNGFQVLQALKGDEKLRHLPVIVASALDDVEETVLPMVQMGADDYLAKPINSVLLRARVDACLEKKRLRDREQAYLEELRIERERSERLLLNVLPLPIAERLKHGENVIADSIPDATVLFADLVGFTELSTRVMASVLIRSLNGIFSALDRLVEKHGLEKIKTLGDAYMAAAGIPTPRRDHAEAAANMALEVLSALRVRTMPDGAPLSVRIGIHTGPVVAGVIGTKKFIYDIWGDTVNTASRMESTATPNSIQVSAETRSRLEGKYVFEERGLIEVKGKGQMRTYFLKGRKGG